MSSITVNQILLLILVILNVIKLALDLQDRRQRRRNLQDFGKSSNPGYTIVSPPAGPRQTAYSTFSPQSPAGRPDHNVQVPDGTSTPL